MSTEKFFIVKALGFTSLVGGEEKGGNRQLRFYTRNK